MNLRVFFEFMFGESAGPMPKADLVQTEEQEPVSSVAPAVSIGEEVSALPTEDVVTESEEEIEEPVSFPTAKKLLKVPYREEVEDAEPEQYMSVKEGAKLFGINYGTFYSRVKEAKIKPSYREGKTGMYKLSELKRFSYDLKKTRSGEKVTVEQKVIDTRYGANSWRNADSYVKWATTIRENIREAGFNDSKVIYEALKKMTRVYGIVWSQVRCDYYQEMHESTKDRMRLAYFLEYEQVNGRAGFVQRLFENLCNNICETSVA